MRNHPMIEPPQDPKEQERAYLIEQTRNSLELNHFEIQLYKNEKIFELKIKETFMEGATSPDIYEKLETNPKEFIEALELWLATSYDTKRTILLTDFPKDASFQTNISTIRSKDKDRLLFITGVVKSKSEITVITTRIDRECPDCSCKISHNYEIGQEIKKYYYCPQCLRTNKNHRYMKNTKEHKQDLFYITLEESPEDNTSGELARIPILFEGRLADPEIAQKITRGTKVTIAGTLRLVTRVTKYGTNAEHYLIKTFGLEVIGEEQMKVQMNQEVMSKIQEIRNNNNSMVEYWATNMYKNIEGEQKIKESIIVQLVGNPLIIKGNKKTRGDIHIILFGDAGTVKSTFLKLTQVYALKSRFAQGGGSTGVGITASIVKDELIGGWTCEAGAMPLAHKGTLCLDEIDKLDEEDVKKLHEGLEQQTITTDKGNVHVTMPCQTSILGAGNPKFGMFDIYKNIYEQIEFPPAFLNRFDLIWVMIDKPNAEKDKKIAEKIIQNLAGTEEVEDITLFKQYLTLAKSIQVTTTKEIEKEIITWYENIRKRTNSEGKSIRLNARSVETIIRLMMAHTKSELREVISSEDFNWAKEIFLESIKLIATDSITGEIDTQIISTGYSHTQNQLIGIILKALDESPEKEMTYQDIRECIDKKIPDYELDNLLQKMRNGRSIFEPRNGIYHLL